MCFSFRAFYMSHPSYHSNHISCSPSYHRLPLTCECSLRALSSQTPIHVHVSGHDITFDSHKNKYKYIIEKLIFFTLLCCKLLNLMVARISRFDRNYILSIHISGLCTLITAVCGLNFGFVERQFIVKPISS